MKYAPHLSHLHSPSLGTCAVCGITDENPHILEQCKASKAGLLGIPPEVIDAAKSVFAEAAEAMGKAQHPQPGPINLQTTWLLLADAALRAPADERSGAERGRDAADAADVVIKRFVAQAEALARETGRTVFYVEGSGGTVIVERVDNRPEGAAS